jgi:PAS domain S-box-containing protein
MRDEDKTKRQLIAELAELRERLGNTESKPESVPSEDHRIQVSNIDMEWYPKKGTCFFESLPVAMMWVDTTLAGLLSGVQSMVGTDRFLLALQSEGRNSVEADWQVISQFSDFSEGFEAIANIAAVAGWGNWRLISLDEENRVCCIRIWSSWEGRYQKTLGVAWGSGMLAGKMAGYCSKLFGANCWAEQSAFIAKGDEYDEFVVCPSERSVEEELEKLLTTDQATRADMAVALTSLRREISERIRVENELRRMRNELERRVAERTEELSKVNEQLLKENSDRCKAEETLRESEERFRSVYESNMLGIGFWGRDGEVFEANDAYLATIGHSRDDLANNRINWKEITPEQHLPSDLHAIEEIMASGHCTPYEKEYQLPDGTRVSVILGGARTSESSDWGIAFALDISERKRSEEAVLESERRLRQVIDLVPHMIFAKDEEGRFLLVNRVVAEAYGTTVEDLTGKKHADYHKDDAELHNMLNDDREVINTGRAKFIPEESFVDSQGRTRLLQTAKIPFVTSGLSKPAILGVAVDITDRKLAEDQIRISLKEKEVLLREVHHRVKNNLAVVNSLLKLQSRNAKDEFHRQMFLDAQDRIRSMALAHERLCQSDNLAHVNMDEYVASLVDHLFLSAKGIGSIVDIIKNVENVQVSLDRAVPLGFLINELISNSLRHAHPNQDRGSIELSLRTVGQDEFELTVKDDGVGIPESVDLEEPQSFGLNLVKLFAQQLHGEMELIRDGGTEFRIRFRDTSSSGEE